MKAWFINLDRSPERLAHMKSVLGKLDIAFERIKAVDGRDLTEAQINEVHMLKNPMFSNLIADRLPFL
ncbi:MAG: glycosyltransferase family 25 protein [Ahrensia sp.]|nr:glycosyltransferase family 25 protein [Ahrensia sp.]